MAMFDAEEMLGAIDQLAGGAALSIDHARSLVGIVHMATTALGIDDGLAEHMFGSVPDTNDAGLLAASVAIVAKSIANWLTDNPYQVGRGYTEHDRAPIMARMVEPRFVQYSIHPLRFQDMCGLLPEEFNWLFHRVAPQLAALRPRKMRLEDRLLMALRRLQTGQSEKQIGDFFGVCKTTANDDIDPIISGVLYNSQNLRDEISWPTQAERDFGLLSQTGIPHTLYVIVQI